MKSKAKVEAFLGYRFSSGGITGEDYKKFERAYRAYLRELATKNGLELASFLKGHYNFSCFIRDAETKECLYISISDVRYFEHEWHDQILVRTAHDIKDYTGGTNHRVSLNQLDRYIKRWTSEKAKVYKMTA